MDRQTERQSDTTRHIEVQTETDKMDRQTDRQSDTTRHIEVQTETDKMDRQTDSHIEPDTQKYRYRDRQVGQTDRETEISYLQGPTRASHTLVHRVELPVCGR